MHRYKTAALLAGGMLVLVSTTAVTAHDGDALPTAEHQRREFTPPQQPNGSLPTSAAATRERGAASMPNVPNAPMATDDTSAPRQSPIWRSDSYAVPGNPAFGRIDTP